MWCDINPEHRTGWWVYGFLEWKGGITAAWYIGVGAAFVVVYFIQFLFHMLRDWVARKLGKAPRKHEMQQVDEEGRPEQGEESSQDSGVAYHHRY